MHLDSLLSHMGWLLLTDSPRDLDPDEARVLQLGSGSDDGAADSEDGEYEYVMPCKPARLEEVELELEGENSGHFILDCETAIDWLGIGAFCLFHANWHHMVKLVLVSLQGFFIEYAILYYLVSIIVSDYGASAEEEKPPLLIYYIAVFLHIVNTIHSLPLALSISLHFVKLKRSWTGLIVQGTLFFVDSFITPSAVIVIGSLYLCTSQSIGDIILNSCAVAFIGTIDDYIIAMHHYTNKLGGIELEEEYVLYLPHARGLMSAVNWSLCILPIVPAALTYTLVTIGIEHMNL